MSGRDCALQRRFRTNAARVSAPSKFELCLNRWRVRSEATFDQQLPAMRANSHHVQRVIASPESLKHPGRLAPIQLNSPRLQHRTSVDVRDSHSRTSVFGSYERTTPGK